jgi:hypothetical protein
MLRLLSKPERSRLSRTSSQGIRGLERHDGKEVRDNMWLFSFVRAGAASWLGDERGQGTTEYVLLILGVVLFLIVAALALQGILNGAIDQISTWVSQQNAP